MLLWRARPSWSHPLCYWVGGTCAGLSYITKGIGLKVRPHTLDAVRMHCNPPLMRPLVPAWEGEWGGVALAKMHP